MKDIESVLAADSLPGRVKCQRIFGLFHPQLLRPYGNRLEPLMVRALLSGGPDELADAFLEHWEQTHTLPSLEALALIRTDHARELVRSARDTVDEPSDWYLLMQLAGTLPDSGRPSGFWPACMGFIADRQQSPHTVGGLLELHPNQTGISDESTDESNQHQVGGLPNWITVDRHPRCPECGNSMPFLASIGGNLTPFGNLAFDGTLYCFWCDDCCVSSTKYQT